MADKAKISVNGKALDPNEPVTGSPSNATITPGENTPVNETESTSAINPELKVTLEVKEEKSPVSAVELSYEADLAARIADANHPVTRVAHIDFVRMNAAGLIDFETKKLKTGHQLTIDETNTLVGTYSVD